MKRTQKVQQALVAQTCAGNCPEAGELRAQVDEAAEVMDREWQALVRNRDEMVQKLRELHRRVQVLESALADAETRGAVY